MGKSIVSDLLSDRDFSLWRPSEKGRNQFGICEGMETFRHYATEKKAVGDLAVRKTDEADSGASTRARLARLEKMNSPVFACR
ncbi:hypothetical protein WN48_07462 [Eufriesea mexicana]|uniref:Uncharacterized protein n=1 Tax=Eufriesea mexicana TaxID=516756 RepID=A0A310SNE1_9HYME|nr:hypothetical protein WN48_07462 [Eufriesea mexicana]